MKKASRSLMILACITTGIHASQPNHKIKILDKLIFENKTPFEIEDLEVKIPDPKAYTTSLYNLPIKIAPNKAADYPILSESNKKIASSIEWQFNERTIPQISRQLAGRNPGTFHKAVILAKQDLADKVEPLGFLLEINILAIQPKWCTKNKKRLKCTENFIITKDPKVPYKFIISLKKA